MAREMVAEYAGLVLAIGVLIAGVLIVILVTLCDIGGQVAAIHKALIDPPAVEAVEEAPK